MSGSLQYNHAVVSSLHNSAQNSLPFSQKQQSELLLKTNGLQASLFAHIYDDHIELLNADGTGQFDLDTYKFYQGSIICMFQDHRTNCSSSCTGKWAALRPNPHSVWNDILRLNQISGGTWTTKMGLELESKLLLALYPKPDLSPAHPTPALATQTVENEKEQSGFFHRVPLKKKKRKLNSLEMEEERAKKDEYEKLMYLMDPRHGVVFHPTWAQQDYFEKKKKSKIGIPADSRGKLKLLSNNKNEQELNNGIRNMVKRMRFERTVFLSEGKNYKYHTFIVIYHNQNGKYDAFMHRIAESDFSTVQELQIFLQTLDEEGTFFNLKDDRATLQYQFHNEKSWRSFIKSFTVLYIIDHNLRFDWDAEKEEEKLIVAAIQRITEEVDKVTTPQPQSRIEARDLVEAYYKTEQPDYLPNPIYQYTHEAQTQEILLDSVDAYLKASSLEASLNKLRPMIPALSKSTQYNPNIRATLSPNQDSDAVEAIMHTKLSTPIVAMSLNGAMSHTGLQNSSKTTASTSTPQLPAAASPVTLKDTSLHLTPVQTPNSVHNISASTTQLKIEDQTMNLSTPPIATPIQQGSPSIIPQSVTPNPFTSRMPAIHAIQARPQPQGVSVQSPVNRPAVSTRNPQTAPFAIPNSMHRPQSITIQQAASANKPTPMLSVRPVINPAMAAMRAQMGMQTALGLNEAYINAAISHGKQPSIGGPVQFGRGQVQTLGRPQLSGAGQVNMQQPVGMPSVVTSGFNHSMIAGGMSPGMRNMISPAMQNTMNGGIIPVRGGLNVAPNAIGRGQNPAISVGPQTSQFNNRPYLYLDQMQFQMLQRQIQMQQQSQQQISPQLALQLQLLQGQQIQQLSQPQQQQSQQSPQQQPQQNQWGGL